MEKLLLRAFLFIALVIVTSCGGTVTSDPSVGLDNYTVLSGAFTQQDTASLTGTGVARFDSNLAGISSNESIELLTEMDTTGSSTAVVFNSDDSGLSDAHGVILKLTRNSSAGIDGTISVQGSTVLIQSTNLAFLTPGYLDIIIEVHNTPSTTRVLLWQKDSVTYSLANVTVDSGVSSDLNGVMPVGGGLGFYSGLKLNASQVITARFGDANVTIP